MCHDWLSVTRCLQDIGIVLLTYIYKNNKQKICNYAFPKIGNLDFILLSMGIILQDTFIGLNKRRNISMFFIFV